MDTSAARGDGNGGGGGEPHVLVVPFPAQGHMIAHLDLAALLATRGGMAVTVAVTAGNAPLLEPLLAACPSVGVVTLPFPPSPLLPPGCGENTRGLPWRLFWMFVPALAALRAPLLDWCEAQHQRRRRVTAIVSDLFTGWARPLADELGAAHVTFSPSTAFFVAMAPPTWHPPSTPTPMPQSSADADADADADTDEAAAAALLFPHVADDPKPGDEAYEEIRQILLWSLENKCIVVNSFTALEAAYWASPLAARLRSRSRVLSVGPLSEAWPTCGNRGGRPAVAASEVAAWLDAFDDGAVVYVSFGTQHALSVAQAACVAEALARSSAAFVWATGGATAVPEGLEAATAAARGMVIHGWAPQVAILRHRAVGWFLMHCGTNAVLEAAAAGVAVLAWPMGADHFVNRALLEEAGVAVRLAEGGDAVPDAGEMAKAIAAVIGDEGKPFRERAVRLAAMAAAAVAEGGSSYRDLQELIHMLAKIE
uniref:Glycosyltransferase n=1 Tax=Oryza glumipatula TaxID=40148 RepID=A0A0E0BLM0_9ORYZ